MIRVFWYLNNYFPFLIVSVAVSTTSILKTIENRKNQSKSKCLPLPPHKTRLFSFMVKIFINFTSRKEFKGRNSITHLPAVLGRQRHAQSKATGSVIAFELKEKREREKQRHCCFTEREMSNGYFVGHINLYGHFWVVLWILRSSGGHLLLNIHLQ